MFGFIRKSTLDRQIEAHHAYVKQIRKDWLLALGHKEADNARLQMQVRDLHRQLEELAALHNSAEV